MELRRGAAVFSATLSSLKDGSHASMSSAREVWLAIANKTTQPVKKSGIYFRANELAADSVQDLEQERKKKRQHIAMIMHRPSIDLAGNHHH